MPSDQGGVWSLVLFALVVGAILLVTRSHKHARPRSEDVRSPETADDKRMAARVRNLVRPTLLLVPS